MPWIVRTLLTIVAITLPLFIYVGMRIASSVDVLLPGTRAKARRIVFLVIGWLYLLPVSALLFQLFGSFQQLFVLSTTVRWEDYLLHYPVWIGLILVLELSPIFGVVDLVGLSWRRFPGSLPAYRKYAARARLLLAIVGVLYIIVRTVSDTTHVRDSEIQLGVAGIPKELEGTVISLVGDIQVDRYTGDAKVSQVRAIVNRRQPDFLFSSGDLVTSGTDFLGEAARAVCGLHGSTGTVAVMGDHDFWSAPEAIRDLHEQCGWAFLDDEHHLYSVRGKTVLVTGLTYIYSRRQSPEELQRFFSTAPHADFKILLTHQPAERVVQIASAMGYNLIVAGHTHGGQVVLHPLGIPLTPSMRETRYYSGCYTVGSTQVVVTRGVGLTLAPIRYNSPAEVTTIVLRQALEVPATP